MNTGKGGYRKYSEEQKKLAAQIWVDLGGNNRALKEARALIKEKVGMDVPADGRSLKNWKKKYKIKPKSYEDGLFPLVEQNLILVHREGGKEIKEVDFDKVTNIFNSLFGTDFSHSVDMLNLICKKRLNLKDPEILKKIIAELKEMTVDEVETLISKIIKRIRENIQSAIDLSDYDPSNPASQDRFLNGVKNGMDGGDRGAI